jgi:hypothetical protein
MAEISLLSGKVRKQALPTLGHGSSTHAILLKRLLLAQGELAQFHDSDIPIHYLACIELRAGQVRGNHYHEIKEERIYVMQGALDLVLEDIDSRRREILPLQTGDLAVIQPRVAHALQMSQPGWAVEFSVARFDPADTHRYALTV